MTCSLRLAFFVLAPGVAVFAQDTGVVSFYGYDDCIRLANETTRVTLCPAAGGVAMIGPANARHHEIPRTVIMFVFRTRFQLLS